MMIKFLFLISFFISTLFSNEKGICLNWSEGDSISLNECKSSTLKECSNSKKPLALKDTIYQNYKGKLFSSTDGSISEFRNESANNCESLLIENARTAEKIMSSQWEYSVHSKNLKKGDSAFVYGKSVILREKPDSNSKKKLTLEDNTKLEIIGKSKEEVVVGKNPKSFWFQVKINSTEGWIYGAFIHPNPKSKDSFIN